MLDHLRLLWGAPTATAALVLCGAGCERVPAPAPASRVLTRHELTRLGSARLPRTLRLFHHLWEIVATKDVRHVDDTVARGDFRIRAGITFHLHVIRVRRPDAVAGRELLGRACAPGARS
ncbi:hypothetical protein OG948_00335 [Embleya sp. NBC_00888]|uniref:hypothetical protein n=1 Tax=Embleya sp. NBC_00888 TaxID=2975960 RepID=UPI00386B14CA|nr:hypothetical protein OG948_00335 [Embleya sp. NBC_00888]